MAESRVELMALVNIHVGAPLNPMLKASAEDLLRLVRNNGYAVTERLLHSFAPNKSLSGCKR